MARTGSESSAGGTTPRIVATDDVLGGQPRIEGRRIGVAHVYEQYVDAGETADAIATAYDLRLAEVHAALAYAFDNPEEMRELNAARRGRSHEDAETERLTPDDQT